MPADATTGCRDCGATAAIYHDDLPSGPRPRPRFIPEFAMAQLEDPERLAMLPDATTPALVIVIMGRRASYPQPLVHETQEASSLCRVVGCGGEML